MLDTILLKDEASGEVLLRPCLEIMMFSSTPLHEGADEFLKTYEALHSRIGDSIRYYKTNDMSREKKLTSGADEQVKLILGNKKAVSAEFYALEQHSGEAASDYAMPSFELLSEREKITAKKIRDYVVFRVCLDPDAHRDLPKMLEEALTHFPLSSGYCGYSYYWNTGNHKCEQQVQLNNRSWLKRFPGLGHGDPLDLQMYGTDGLLQVGWLTMLGEKYVEQLEPLDEWIANLPNGVRATVVPDTRRLILQIGAKPKLGNRNRNDDLPSYRALGERLAGFRLPEDLINEIQILGLEDEDKRDWLLRFFGDE